MSRERPMPGPKAPPNQADFQRAAAKLNLNDERDQRRRAEMEKLKGFSGSAFMGYLASTFSRGQLKRAPQFIRRGYEANIVDELREFYRARAWRPANLRSGMSAKERQKMLRRAEAAGQIRRCGGGRFERIKANKWDYFRGTPAELEKATFHITGEPMGGPIA